MMMRKAFFLASSGIQYFSRAAGEPVLGLEQNSAIIQLLAVRDALAAPARVGVISAADGLNKTAPYATHLARVQLADGTWSERPIPVVGAFPAPASNASALQWWQALSMLAWRLGTGAVAATALTTARSYPPTANPAPSPVQVWGDASGWVTADPAAVLTVPADAASQAAAVYLGSVDFAQRVARAALNQSAASDATASALMNTASPLVASLATQWTDRQKARDQRAMLVAGGVMAAGLAGLAL